MKVLIEIIEESINFVKRSQTAVGRDYVAKGTDNCNCRLVLISSNVFAMVLRNGPSVGQDFVGLASHNLFVIYLFIYFPTASRKFKGSTTKNTKHGQHRQKKPRAKIERGRCGKVQTSHPKITQPATAGYKTPASSS